MLESRAEVMILAGVLSGYRILELGDHPAAAVLGMLLADQGAEILKVESPGGDPLRPTPVFSVWNRGKMSLVADPDDRDDVARVRRLVRDADVVVESFASGANPYGVDYAAARSERADIIHLAMPGFIKDGDFSTDDLAVSAAMGLYADRSADKSEGVSFIALPYASVFAAMVAAPALTAALFHRARTGEGQSVAVPLYDSMFTAMGSAIVRRPDVPSGPGALSPVIERFYRCADGRWINLNAGYERSLRPILNVMEHPEWYDSLTDGRLRENLEEREEWAARFSEVWLERPAIEWEDLMADAGAPLTMCRTLQEWMDTEHALLSGAVAEIDDPRYGPMRQVGVQVRLTDTPGAIRGSAPALGEHTGFS